MKKTPFFLKKIYILKQRINQGIIRVLALILFILWLPGSSYLPGLASLNPLSPKAQPEEPSKTESQNSPPKANKKNYVIVIDVNECRLFLIDNDTKEIVKNYPVALGRLDLPSPMGTWKIINKGHWDEGFGGRWLGLNVPWGTYGIHGTSRPSSIGSYASHGCIRMFNADVKELYNYVSYGTTVIIYGGSNWLFTSYARTIVPGDRGADVYDVQRRLKDLGYYKGSLDGIYGEGMKAVVLKFRKDNNLPATHNVDRDLLKVLEIYKFE